MRWFIDNLGTIVLAIFPYIWLIDPSARAAWVEHKQSSGPNSVQFEKKRLELCLRSHTLEHCDPDLSKVKIVKYKG